MSNKSQVFTPEIYVNKMLNAIGYEGNIVIGKVVLENSCGEGNILKEVVKRYIKAARKLQYSNQKIKIDLEENIIGFEIDKKVRVICLEKLEETARKFGIINVNWNIIENDYLKSSLNKKVDFVIGNPPYITYQELDLDKRNFLRENFSSCTKGKFDYCYAFIEKSINELSNIGRMSYLIPNSIFKNVFGEDLRSIMINNITKIIDYKESSVFGRNILTSPAIICFYNSKKVSYINYYDVDNEKHIKIPKEKLNSKWIFAGETPMRNSKYIKTFGDYYKVSNSVATLLNSAYVIDKKNIEWEDDKSILIRGGYLIEKNVLRPAASSRNFSINREEYIIFPYEYEEGNLKRFGDLEFRTRFPGANKYLNSMINKLSSRKSDKMAKWFEYGRSQALKHLDQEKIILPSVITNEIRYHKISKETIPYSGFYITSINSGNLDYAEEILCSDSLYSYLLERGTNANGKSLRFSVKDILNYPIP